MRKYLAGAVVVGVMVVCGASSLGQSAPTVRAVVHGGRAAWYVGSTSARTRIDFRLSPSGLWVRDFHFGSPQVTCPATGQEALLGDGNFPLIGLRVSHGRFRGNVHPEADSPNSPVQYQLGALVSGRFIDQRNVTGTVTGWGIPRTCTGDVPLTFTATRVRSLPARPVSGGRYAGRTVRASGVRFQVSRSGRRVSAFRFARVWTGCKWNANRNYNGKPYRFRLAHSYPAGGLSQNRVGVFTGILSSRLTPSGRPAGTRVRLSVLFLSSREATGTVRLLGRPCVYETLPWRAALIP